MQYTPKQREAIEKRGTNLLISAAAGSGKTRVLVDRIIHLLVHDQASLDEMLIVTFTNAAAGEMKVRLQEGLQHVIQEAQDEATVSFLREQLKALPNAHISTMHAFCIAELRRYYHILSLDPNFKILSHSTTAILQENAMENTMNIFYEENDEAFQQLIEAYGGKNDDKRVRHMVQHLARSIQTHAAPLEWLHTAIESFTEEPSAAYGDLVRAEVLETVQLMREECDLARACIGAVPALSAQFETIIEDEGIVQGLGKCAQKDNVIEALFQYLSQITFEKVKNNPEKDNEEAILAHEQYKEIRKRFKKHIDKLKALQIVGGYARICDDRQMVLPYLQVLEKLVIAYLENYQAEKRAKDGMDFNDLEHGLLSLLADEETRNSIRHEVQYIFFDEYQDANPIQEAIVNALSNEDKMFFVGDVKQAIYRFRLADPNIFNARYAQYRDKKNGELIFLAENFRSRQEIIQFCNALFYPLMTQALGEVNYTEKGQALVCGAEKSALKEAVQCVGVSVSKEIETEYHLEALWIAEEINHLVKSGDYEYGDIVVLMRSPRARLQDFEEIFKLKKIPLYADNSNVSFQNLEVRLFKEMLTVLNNDELDHALLATLLSPFGGLTDNEVACIRATCDEGSFSKAVQHYKIYGEDEVLCGKLERFYRRLRHWRKVLRYESLSCAALTIFEESGYGAFLLGLEDGVEAYQNVVSFIDLVEEYEKEQQYGLPGFLYYLEMLEKRNMDSQERGIALSSNDGCVRLMSIHKSKGLGFKVVFLADLKHSFNFRDTSEALICDKDLGLAMEVVDLAHNVKHRPFESKLMKIKMKNETRSEEVRLLYVALTRAIDRLYLVSAVNDKDIEDWQSDVPTSATTGSLKQLDSYYAWLKTCMRDPRTSLYKNSHTPLYQLKHVVLDEMVEAISQQQRDIFKPLEIESEDKLIQEITKRFSASYAYTADTKKPFKKTVSELTKGNDIQPDHIKKWPKLFQESRKTYSPAPLPLFLQEHISLTGAAFGTLMHQVVQLLPFVAHSRDEIEQLLQALYEQVFFTKEEYEAIDINMLVEFYNSDFVKAVAERAILIENEISFTLKVEDLMVDGQIDMFFETEEGYEIIDFKTDREIQPALYEKQLDMYARALSAARGKPVVKKWLYWLRHQQATLLEG